MSVRRAVPGDLRELLAVAERAFRETFEATNDPGDMEAYCEKAFAEGLWAAELEDPACTFLVGGGQHPGLRQGEGGHRPRLRGRTGPAGARADLRRRRGPRIRARVGTPPGRLDHARSLGRRTIWLGVWEENHRALAFYAKNGFTPVGAKTFVLGSDVQTDRVLARPL
ncbi:MAG: GNAT family N-acetyltransferase [Alphaproteobacteria bacterium]|nr:GNAT family N-acetyltransferase [Alphaproteobacteria bacterium]